VLDGVGRTQFPREVTARCVRRDDLEVLALLALHVAHQPQTLIDPDEVGREVLQIDVERRRVRCVLGTGGHIRVSL
jgi:hypothetical protein